MGGGPFRLRTRKLSIRIGSAQPRGRQPLLGSCGIARGLAALVPQHLANEPQRRFFAGDQLGRIPAGSFNVR